MDAVAPPAGGSLAQGVGEPGELADEGSSGGDGEAEAEGGEGAGGSGGKGACGDDPLAGLGLPPGSSGQLLLAAFIRRMNAALLGGAALDGERLRLGAENATLRAVVATVKAGTQVGAGAVDDPLNTLLIVNGRLQKELGGAAAQRRAIAVSNRSGGGAATMGASAGLLR